MEKSQRTREGRGGSRKRIVITECEVTPVDAHGFGSGVKGLASITLNNALVLRSLRIIKDREGNLTVAYPAQMGRDKTWYDLVEPKSDSLREEVARHILAEYRRAVEALEIAEGARQDSNSEGPGGLSEPPVEDEPPLAQVHHEPPESSTGESAS